MMNSSEITGRESFEGMSGCMSTVSSFAAFSDRLQENGMALLIHTSVGIVSAGMLSVEKVSKDSERTKPTRGLILVLEEKSEGDKGGNIRCVFEPGDLERPHGGHTERLRRSIARLTRGDQAASDQWLERSLSLMSRSSKSRRADVTFENVKEYHYVQKWLDAKWSVTKLQKSFRVSFKKPQTNELMDVSGEHTEGSTQDYQSPNLARGSKPTDPKFDPAQPALSIKPMTIREMKSGVFVTQHIAGVRGFGVHSLPRLLRYRPPKDVKTDLFPRNKGHGSNPEHLSSWLISLEPALEEESGFLGLGIARPVSVCHPLGGLMQVGGVGLPDSLTYSMLRATKNDPESRTRSLSMVFATSSIDVTLSDKETALRVGRFFWDMMTHTMKKGTRRYSMVQQNILGDHREQGFLSTPGPGFEDDGNQTGVVFHTKEQDVDAVNLNSARSPLPASKETAPWSGGCKAFLSNPRPGFSIQRNQEVLVCKKGDLKDFILLSGVESFEHTKSLKIILDGYHHNKGPTLRKWKPKVKEGFTDIDGNEDSPKLTKEKKTSLTHRRHTVGDESVGGVSSKQVEQESTTTSIPVEKMGIRDAETKHHYWPQSPKSVAPVVAAKNEDGQPQRLHSPVGDAPRVRSPAQDAPRVHSPARDAPAVGSQARDAPAMGSQVQDAPAAGSPARDAPHVISPVQGAPRSPAHEQRHTHQLPSPSPSSSVARGSQDVSEYSQAVSSCPTSPSPPSQITNEDKSHHGKRSKAHRLFHPFAHSHESDHEKSHHGRTSGAQRLPHPSSTSSSPTAAQSHLKSEQEETIPGNSDSPKRSRFGRAKGWLKGTKGTVASPTSVMVPKVQHHGVAKGTASAAVSLVVSGGTGVASKVHGKIHHTRERLGFRVRSKSPTDSGRKVDKASTSEKQNRGK